MSRKAEVTSRSLTLGIDVPAPVAPKAPPARKTPASREWVELIDITPAMAQQWLNEHQFNGQRRVSDQHIAKLVYAIKSGSFPTTEFRFVHIGKKSYLTDGQHRCHAVVNTGVPIRGNILHTHGRDMADVAGDYTANPGPKIRDSHALLSATDLPGRSELSATNFRAFGAGVRPIMGGLTPKSFHSGTPETSAHPIHARAVGDFIPEARMFFDAIYDAPMVVNRSLRRKPVVALALITFRYQPEQADRFWRIAAQNDGLRRGDPRHTLVYWLANHGARDVSDIEYFGGLARLWNSFFRAETNHGPKPHNPPFLIEGTGHYDGKSIYLPYGE